MNVLVDMELDRILNAESPALMRRLRPMLGSTESAEDLLQATLERALTSAPQSANEEHLRGWLHRVASNLAVDELRRRNRRRLEPLEDGLIPAVSAFAPEDSIATREALERLSAHERLLLLLRFQSRLGHAEIAALLDISEPAARQRLSRARRAFVEAFRRAPLDGPPRVYVLLGQDEPEAYMRWLRDAGAEARELPRHGDERDVAMADASLIGGSRSDIDPASYGERPRAELADPDLARDRQDIAVIRTALEQDIPIVGICHGHQLLNVAFGGTLHQDLTTDHVVAGHPRRHTVRSLDGSFTRRVLGRPRPGLEPSPPSGQAFWPRAARRLALRRRADRGGRTAAPTLRPRRSVPPRDEITASDRLLAAAVVDAAARRAA